MADFPHCNSDTIHAPRVCFYCDQHPDLQAARAMSGRDYDSPEANGWSGNVAVQAGQTHSHLGGTWVVGQDLDEHWDDNYNVVGESEAWLSIADLRPPYVPADLEEPCGVNFKAGWRCTRGIHYFGPCALVPRWWNWGPFARRCRRAFR